MKQILFVVALFAGGLSADALIIDENAPKDILAQMDSSDSTAQNPSATTQNKGAIPPNQGANQAKNAPDSKGASNQVANPSANGTKTPTPQEQLEAKANQPIDPDVKLKDDIVGFEREKYFQRSAKVDDPFIYVYQQSEDEVAIRAKLEQAVLILKSIIVAPDSNDNGIKRYKAHINNKWVEECKMERRKRVCDSIEGWEVASISESGVKLRVTRYNLKKDLELSQQKVKIEKEASYK